MSLASWLDGVNKKHANTVYASPELDREYRSIRRRRSKSLGDVGGKSVMEDTVSTGSTPATPLTPSKPRHIQIPQSNFNPRDNTPSKWSGGAGLKTPTPTTNRTPRTPKTPKTVNSPRSPRSPHAHAYTHSWTQNRVVGASLFSNTSAIPSPKERGIPVSPNVSSKRRAERSERVEYPGFAEAVNDGRRHRPPVVSHHSDVFGIARKGGKLSAANTACDSEEDKEDTSARRASLRRSSSMNSKSRTGGDGDIGNYNGTSNKVTYTHTNTSQYPIQEKKTDKEKGPVMRARQPNVLRRWQPESAEGSGQRGTGARKVSPSLRQLKTRSLPTYPTYSMGEMSGMTQGERNSHVHNVHNTLTSGHSNTHTPARATENSTPNDADSEAGNVSQSSLVELEVSEGEDATQFDLATTPRRDIFSSLSDRSNTTSALNALSNTHNPAQLFPHVVAPKPLHVHVGNPLGRIEEEANVVQVHRPLPVQPKRVEEVSHGSVSAAMGMGISNALSARNTQNAPITDIQSHLSQPSHLSQLSPLSPNRGRPLPSPHGSNTNSPLASPNLPTPRHAALPTPPPSSHAIGAFADAVQANHQSNPLRPSRSYKPTLSRRFKTHVLD
ncbi:hypothetical protein E3P98_04040 [Wallemia ichthyophaga]|nr:hypothetical protein E3P98_04040 [Wallemia ichthyophaga]